LVAGTVLFVIAEVIAVIFVFERHHSNSSFAASTYLLPLFCAVPLLAGITAHGEIKRQLVAHQATGVGAFVRHSLVVAFALVYMSLVLILTLLLHLLST
jgi:hypothetical protein